MVPPYVIQLMFECQLILIVRPFWFVDILFLHDEVSVKRQIDRRIPISRNVFILYFILCTNTPPCMKVKQQCVTLILTEPFWKECWLIHVTFVSLNERNKVPVGMLVVYLVQNESMMVNHLPSIMIPFCGASKAKRHIGIILSVIRPSICHAVLLH